MQTATPFQRSPLNPDQPHPASTGAKLCADCAHAHIHRQENPARCWHPAHGFDVVTGKPNHMKCRDARSPRFGDSNVCCGQEGLWFTPLAVDPQHPAAQS